MGSPLLYEINTRCWLADLSDQFAHPITLGNVPDAVLEAWRQFGFSYVWLMGVWATGPKSRSIALQQPWIQEYGKLLPGFTEQDVGASPYAISSYAVDPAVGGDAELREFRRRLNAAGLKLVLDFIPNHTGLDHPWLTTRPELYVQSEGGFETPGLKQLRIAHGKDPYFPAWTDTAQLDYRSAETHAVMSDELASVAARCDGVRCDMAMLVLRDVFANTWRGTETKHPLARAEFWPAAIARCKSQFPEFVFIAEVYWGLEERLVGMGFDYAYDKTLYDAVLRNDPGGVREHIYSTARHRLARSVHFLENHDEPRIASLLGLQQHRAAAILILGLPGMRLIHEGQLTGRRVRLPVQLRRRPPEPEDPQIAAMYAELLKISSKSAVGRGDWSLFESQPSTIDKEIRIRWSGEERVDIVSVDLSSLSACIISGSEENSS